MKKLIDISESVTPKDLAELYWNMASDEQAEFYAELYEIAGSHKLVLQGLHIREDCKKHSSKALDGFQYMSSCAFKWYDGFSTLEQY